VVYRESCCHCASPYQLEKSSMAVVRVSDCYHSFRNAEVIELMNETYLS
jgi:hypothetical protein